MIKQYVNTMLFDIVIL